MKTLFVSLLGLLISHNVWSNNFNHRNDYIYFQEKNVSFYLYPNGTFDFEVHHYERPTETRVFASISTPYLQINYRGGGRDYYSKPYVSYDRYGKLRQVGDVYIDYDSYGNVTYIGNVQIHYYNGYVSSIGHPRANYAYYKKYYRPYRPSYNRHAYHGPVKSVYHHRKHRKPGYAYGRHH